MARTCEQKIKDAFLRVLEHTRLDDMTIVEVVGKAAVSRSTFYLRFGSLANLYDALVTDMLMQTSPITMQIDCSDCKKDSLQNSSKPFCELVRNSGKYAPLVKEDRFLATVLRITDIIDGASIVQEGMQHGLDYQQAYALHVFQMSGCFAASVMSKTSDADWPRVKQAIDAFISAGINNT